MTECDSLNAVSCLAGSNSAGADGSGLIKVIRDPLASLMWSVDICVYISSDAERYIS